VLRRILQHFNTPVCGNISGKPATACGVTHTGDWLGTRWRAEHTATYTERSYRLYTGCCHMTEPAWMTPLAGVLLPEIRYSFSTYFTPKMGIFCDLGDPFSGKSNVPGLSNIPPRKCVCKTTPRAQVVLERSISTFFSGFRSFSRCPWAQWDGRALVARLRVQSLPLPAPLPATV
jgi:hypothetical protein